MRRIVRLESRGLISVEERSSQEIFLALTNHGTELLSRQMERRRRRVRRTRADREELSVFSSASNACFYASKLFVSLYRCFGDEQLISFAGEDGRIARWTFLIGENGVGKTTVLQALAGLFPMKGNRRSRPSLILETLSEGDTLFGSDIEDDSWIEVEFHQGELEIEVVDPVILGAIGRHTSLDDLEVSLQLAADSVTMTWGGQYTYIANYEVLPRAPLIVGYGASRAVGRSSMTSDKDRSSAIHSLFYPETPLQDPEDWLLRNDYAARMRGASQNVSRTSNEKLSMALLDILPDVSAISILPPDDRHDRPYVGFQTSHGIVDYRSLSIGYQSTLAWIVDLAIRLIENYPDAENPLAMPVIVLIDEIDIHLHPTWQRSITKHLQNLFPAAQFIATTHSPLIIQGAVDANLVLLKAEGDQVVVVNDVDEIRNFRVDQILTSELFGLQSARPDDQASLALRRVEILSNANPKAYSAELADIERQLDTWQTTDSKAVSSSTLDLLKQFRS
ncbi:AAA family ATPase [Sphingomonas aurantiaca]|uniref:AAA family ATPase n=1 Tax=Sphingomonas aurantiaca TaxID=185949 RepID=UPI003364EE6D